MNDQTISRSQSLWGLGGWLLICFVPAAIGSMSMPGDWYAELRRPAWNPPAWVFGPAWTTLYTMMAVAAWLVWKRGGLIAQRRALMPFLLQLALNAAWSPVFFGLQRPGLAFAVILLLWLAIAWTIAAFWRVDRIAAGLLCPYLAWVSFATALNGTLWRLNA